MTLWGALPQPPVHSSGRHRLGNPPQGGHVVRVTDQFARLAVDMVEHYTGLRRRSHQQGHHVTLGNIGQQGQDLVTHPVATMHRLGIGRINHRGELHGGTHLLGFDTAQPQDRMGWARAHACQTGKACTPQHVEYHRFSLIVSGMAGGGIRAKHSPSGLTGPGLKVGPRLHSHPFAAESGTQPRRSIRNHVSLGVGTITQPMINVDRSGPTTGRHRQHQQCQ
jgi:hypothetical protein